MTTERESLAHDLRDAQLVTQDHRVSMPYAVYDRMLAYLDGRSVDPATDAQRTARVEFTLMCARLARLDVADDWSGNDAEIDFLRNMIGWACVALDVDLDYLMGAEEHCYRDGVRVADPELPHGLNPRCTDPDSDLCALHQDTPITWSPRTEGDS